jgi:hypothetical protein
MIDVGVSSFLLHSTTMEDKRGTKRPHSLSRQDSSSLNSISTQLSAPSGSPSPPGSLSEVSSLRLCSPIFEQGGPSERISMVDLSSNEEDLIPDTSRDEEFNKRLFGDFNREIFELPDDDKVIVLSDSDEEKEVCEEDAADTEATPSSVVLSLTLTVSAADTDDAPEGVKDDSNDGRTPDRAQGDSSSGGDEAGLP